MNPHDFRQAWFRLAATARAGRDERDLSAPYGFATRVAAIAMAAPRLRASLLERFAFRAVGVACLLAIASVAVNTFAFRSDPVVNDLSATAATVEDPMAVLLDA
ncbi:hypothetical protein [Opitutus sp. ER46]|uniref:hypothetical protein n=1 Tax=Opitutus sp. ER46 TaxID=2161864 RepID=UPI000D321E70|nr:hypothetical protein [Opitutus sp. ER46]PTX96664.1 hypothetical protein DB354_08400 [Opitutus sp. ER46]